MPVQCSRPTLPAKSECVAGNPQTLRATHYLGGFAFVQDGKQLMDAALVRAIGRPHQWLTAFCDVRYGFTCKLATIMLRVTVKLDDSSRSL
jgi:hypothetical protein